jgi:hypothetical protein
MKLRTALLCLTLGWTPAAHAQTTATDSAKEVEVRKLMDLTVGGTQFADMMRGMFSQIRQWSEKYSEKYRSELPKEDQERMSRVMDRAYEKMIQRLDKQTKVIIDAMVPVYAKHFTIEEIKGIIAFFESPIGKKWLAETPSIQQESMAAIFPKLQKMNEELMEFMNGELRKEFPNMPPLKKPGESN